MSNQTYRAVTGPIFGAIAFLHLLRLVWGWEAMIDFWIVPQWLSWAALFIAGGLSYASFKK